MRVEALEKIDEQGDIGLPAEEGKGAGAIQLCKDRVFDDMKVVEFDAVDFQPVQQRGRL